MQTAFNHTISKTVKCKRWEKFIKEVTQNDEDKADFLQRALGYSMLGILKRLSSSLHCSLSLCMLVPHMYTVYMDSLSKNNYA